jgi:DNA excision repair protein ERCC-3
VLQHLPQGFAVRAKGGKITLKPAEVGSFRIAAASAGWPVLDTRTASADTRTAFELLASVALRPYQRDAMQALLRARDGVVLLPCGAGKTIVGIATAAAHSTRTLILTPSRSVAEQWQALFRACTTIVPEAVGIIERGSQPRPITIATYHAATIGSVAGTLFDHPWGLVIYDEVQSLPADVFRMSAAYSAFRRVGLTATLVREDGREREVVALIGPVVYDEPWTELEHEGWIAPAECVEVRIPPAATRELAMRYKLAATERLLARCAGEQIIVIGTDLALLRAAARTFDTVLVTGATPLPQREETLTAFRTGSIQAVALSRIGSVGIDVPNASVLIQLSGTFGSRQEEAQRLGRILRPQPGKVARFFSLVIDDPREVRFAERRQRFLVDQGYRYTIIPAADLPRARSTAQTPR